MRKSCENPPVPADKAMLINFLDWSSVTSASIREETQRDPIRCFDIVNENLYFVINKVVTKCSNHEIGINRSRDLLQSIAWFSFKV